MGLPAMTEDDLKTLDIDADEDGKLDEAEFCRFVGNLTFAGVDVPVGRKQRVDNRLWMTIATAVVWLLLGRVCRAAAAWGVSVVRNSD